ncbi:MAG: triose-phosphate isomerase [Candidatus Aenigmatarchaeota archaeon]|nr:triose-phosphate isomerase [Candidatus Aenigmarchaeota archaeon]
MKEPFLLVNFKTYEQSTGKNAVALAKRISKIDRNIAVAPQYVDINRLSNICKNIFAQHVDGINFGRNTGHVLAESLKQAGAIGSLINHSEKRIEMKEIELSVKACKRAGLISIVCVPDVKTAAKVDRLKPNYIAIEPPELIESGRAVSKIKPSLITNVAKNVKSKVICGAGISCGDDVKIALELGVYGVLVSSAVVKAEKPEKILKEMIKYV